MRAQNWIRAVVLLSALALVGCNSPTASPQVAGGPTREAGVYTTFTGLVIDTVTGQPLPGVLVEVGTANGKISDTTGASGVYTLSNLGVGTYTATFTKAGYAFAQASLNATTASGQASKTFTVNGVSYTTDTDPFNEYQWALLQLDAYVQTIKADAGTSPLGGVTVPGTGNWTYNPNTGNYSLSGNGSNSLVVTVNEADHTFKVVSSKFGERVWSKSSAISTASMAPLTSGLKGNLKVVFAVQHDANGAHNDVMTQSVAKDGVQLWAREVTSGVGVTPETYGNTTYGPVTVGVGPGVVANAGEFLFDKILPANTRMRLFANPFSQENTATPKWTYYFSGAADADNTQAYINIGGFTTVHNVTTDATTSTALFPAIYSYDNKAIIVGHSVGSVNVNNRLASNGTFTLTFNKPIAQDSFTAFIETTGTTSGTYGEANDDGIWQAGEDVALTAVWDAAGTTVTLSPRDKVGNPYDGVYPYGLEGAPLIIAPSAQALDGTSVAYAPAAVGGVITPPPASLLTIYTEKPINLVAVEYLDSAGAVAPQILGNTSDLPFGGSIRLTFDKALDTRLALQDVFLYKGQNLSAVPASSAAYVAKPTVTIATATPTVMTITFGSALAFKDYYTLHLKTVSSAKTNDTIVNKFIGFRSNHSLSLSKIDVYRNATNVYYTEKPDAAVAYFPVKSDINLTFGTALTGLTPKVELYRFDKITGLSNPDALLKQQITTVNSVAGQVLTINPDVNLELNTQYALAVKLYDAGGNVLFSSQSPEFVKEASVQSAAITTSNLVATGATGGSDYILFTTEQPLTLRDLTTNAYPKAILTNVKIPTVTSTPITTNFKATDPIVLEFNKPLAALGASDVVLYYWRDAGTADTVEAGELTQTPATVTLGTAPNNNIVTITPTGTLAPGLRFAIKALVTSLSDSLDRLTYDTLAPAPGPLGSPYPATKSSLSFVVDNATLVDLGAAPAAANLISNFAVNTKPTGQVYTGVDSAQAGVTLKWDLLKDLPGETAYYKVYQQTPVDSTWKTAPAVTVPEKNWYETLYLTQLDDAVAPLTDVIPGGTMQSYLLNSGAIKYMVQAYTKTGLLRQSNTISVTDTVGPQFVGTTNLSAPTTGTWATLVYVNNTLPTKDTYTNPPGVPLVLTYDFTNTNSELITAYTVSPSFANAGVVATSAYNAARNGITVTLTIAASAVITGGEGFTVTMTDSSGKAAVVNWAAATPVTSLNTIIADTP